MVKDQFGEDKGNIYKPESRFQSFLSTEFEKKNNKTTTKKKKKKNKKNKKNKKKKKNTFS